MTRIFSMIALIAMLGLSATVGVMVYKAINGKPARPLFKIAFGLLIVIIVATVAVGLTNSSP